MHTKINKHQNDPNFFHACSLVLNKPKGPACSPRNPTDLGSLIYKGIHAQLEDKYFW
jgi:hypothetical protein